MTTRLERRDVMSKNQAFERLFLQVAFTTKTVIMKMCIIRPEIL